MKWLGQTKTCDLCGNSLHSIKTKQWFVDGALLHSGKWALMCANCFEDYNIKLGLGKGQKYDIATLKKIDG